jgi:hypothetical protein
MPKKKASEEQATYDLYAVLIPFLPDKVVEGHKDVMTQAESLQTRLKGKRARKVHKCVLYLGSDVKDRDARQTPLGPKSVVYVTGHGNTKLIGTAGDAVSLTPNQMAEKLDGHLPKDLGHQKVMSCNSGSARDGELAADEEKLLSGTDSYIRRLCMALWARGYTALNVYGYQGYTGEQGKHTYVTQTLGGGKKERARQRRVRVCGENGAMEAEQDFNAE